ncbi:hypothetical protein C1H46_039872 [Malus baccata]|uniref:Uncharacterized protein n=1 Tax=Malus baccata TaxID=106549 RepID=A0A540KK79_MALBA|nr:hypothetical protein C1H46_039872 [Malus baccata]
MKRALGTKRSDSRTMTRQTSATTHVGVYSKKLLSYSAIASSHTKMNNPPTKIATASIFGRDGNESCFN